MALIITEDKITTPATAAWHVAIAAIFQKLASQALWSVRGNMVCWVGNASVTLRGAFENEMTDSKSCYS